MPKRLFQTLRFRLTLWNTVVVLIATLLALFAVREAMRLTIEKEAQALMREEALELELAIKQLTPDQHRINDEFSRKVLGHGQHDWFAALLSDDFSPIWKSDNFPSKTDSLGTEQSPERGFSFEQTDERLIIKYRITLPDESQRTIVIGEPTQFIRNDIWQLTKIMLYIGTVLLIVAPAGGFLLARRATSPVRQIITTTRSLDPGHLESRLPIRGSGDELDQISSEINSFVEQISRYIKSQREFVANAAHELRSPITAIQTSVDVTLGKERSLTEYQEELETVSEQCQQLRHLVNQLLELTEIDADLHRNVEPLNLTKLIEKSISVFSGVAEEKEIRIEAQLDSQVIVNGDEFRFRQVINNLLDNALKFSPAASEIKIQLSKYGSIISWSVFDAGPGVPEENLDRIFDRFFQVDHSRKRDARRGNGLGLSICKSIVEQYGGKIRAVNGNPGFYVQIDLPIA